MIFLSLIAVLGIVHLTRFGSILHNDVWFVFLVKRLRALPAISSVPMLPMILALAIPLSLLAFIILLINSVDVGRNGPSLYLFFVYVPVLLYGLGRGNFVDEVNAYVAAAIRGDSFAATQLIDNLRGSVELENEGADVNDWKALHTQALKIISYRGFERTFAVLFWFVIAPAVGALLYRLSVIYREHALPNTLDAQFANKWLWLIELPAVRLMGLIWAFVGNFDSCPWRDSFLDTENSSVTILNNSLRGALSAPTDVYRQSNATANEAFTPESAQEAAEAFAAANENAQDAIEDLVGIKLSPQAEPAYSFALVRSSMSLYSRSLLFCVGVISFATLFI